MGIRSFVRIPIWGFTAFRREVIGLQKHRSKQKKIAIAILAVFGAVVLSAAAVYLFSRLEQSREASPEGAGQALSRTSAAEADERLEENGIPGDDDSEAVASLYYNGQRYVGKERLTTLLILGVDDSERTESAAARNQSQADLLLLAVFDPDSRECALIQLNRDTMCDVPILDADGNCAGLVREQLALAHTYGSGREDSCENTVSAVSRLLYGAEIDNYFALTMDGIPILNDLAGGVTVTVEDDFSAVDPSLVLGETVTLTGENAANFVRSRMNMDDPANIARMRRQREYITALLDAMRGAAEKDPGFVLEAYAAVADALVTDCTLDELADYAERFSGYELSEIVTPAGETVKGEPFMEFCVDETALRDLVLGIFYEPAE